MNQSSSNGQSVRSQVTLAQRFRGITIGLAVGVAVWALLAHWQSDADSASSVFLPTPGRVASAGLAMLQTSEFWTAFAITNLRVVMGFLVAACVAVPLGVLVGSLPSVESYSAPLTDFGRYIPVAALVPLSIVWAGVGDGQKVLVLAIGTFFPVLVLVADAIRRVPITHVESALTLGVSGGSTISRVLWPAALPQIFDAARVGIGLTWSYLLVAEVVASQNGLGYVIIRGQRFLQIDRIFFVIIVLGLLGLLYDRAFTTARPWLFPWAIEEAATSR